MIDSTFQVSVAGSGVGSGGWRERCVRVRIEFSESISFKIEWFS